MFWRRGDAGSRFSGGDYIRGSPRGVNRCAAYILSGVSIPLADPKAQVSGGVARIGLLRRAGIAVRSRPAVLILGYLGLDAN